MHNKKLWNVGVVCVILLFWTLVGYLKHIDITTNTLIGKTTDEIIIMCLENTYPEHQFHVVKSFDEKKDEGIFADESGIAFKVRDTVTYQKRYHFECRDEYLYQLLTKQNYTEKAENILRNYNLELEQPLDFLYTYVEVDDTLNKEQLAQAIKEVLNCVDIPIVVYPKELSFSTNELNYFSIPKWGVFVCDLYDSPTQITAGARFYFENKDESVERLVARIDEVIIKARKSFENNGE